MAPSLGYSSVPMLQVDEVTSEWSVLLVMTEAETSRLLSVILDGFGYQPLECRDRDTAFEHLSQTMPFAAVVDVSMDQAEEICQLVRERGGVALVILLQDDEQDPQEQVNRFQADVWESAKAGPEKILTTLRELASQTS
jgi:DNA-binding response OmpR family regulator